MTSIIQGLAIIALGALLGTGSAQVAAQGDPDAVIKYRQSVMKGQAAHLSAIDQIVKGQVAMGSHLSHHAAALYTLTTFIIDVFPEDSDLGDTRAREEIWEDFEAFTEKAKRAVAAAEALAEAASSGDPTTLAEKVAVVGDSCKSCHEKYRLRR